ncbi:disulfide bond formation protein B [Aliamphritea ceti]|uniref:disulfide bond formation protein B n=1 Tax=Aliamphritea ceti TaxID=1524258 RepID=UPI0021C2F5BC|nr:disulfide bond formation protein B [Aliamphritea ceti]
MLHYAAALGKHAGFWLTIILVGCVLEGVALFYQYVLDYGPCVLCVHIRIWVLAIIALAILALCLRRYRIPNLLLQILSLGAMAGLLERSWMVFAVERNLIESSCKMSTGLPDWFALDKWFPVVFEPWELCGYTPDLLLGITMAEGLLLISLVATVVMATALIGSLKHPNAE